MTLEFCDERVQYTFCKRGSAATLAAGTSDQASVDLMEQALRKQYLNLIRQLTFEPTAGCRATLRRWFCFEYFSRCNVDETRFMPTCTAACTAVKKSCGEANSAFINCGLEYEEQDFGGNTPATFYTGGSYGRQRHVLQRRRRESEWELYLRQETERGKRHGGFRAVAG